MRKGFSWIPAAVLMVGMICPLSASAAAGADLTVTALDWNGGDGQVKPGDTLEFTVTVKNVGDAAASGPIEVQLSFGTESLMLLTHEGALDAGASVMLTSQPWAAVAGDRMLAARVDPAGKVEETNRLNNTKQTNLRVAKDRLTPAYNADIVTGAGMFDLTFNDDFNDLSGFDVDASGREGYKWYVKSPWGYDMTPSDYTVKDGVFRSAYSSRSVAVGVGSMDPRTHVGYDFTWGYMEARVRLPQPITETGGNTAIWSLPKESWCQGLKVGRYVEMDWMEYFGKLQRYATTMHDLESRAGSSRNWYCQSNGLNEHLNDAAWHVMGWLWEDNRLRCFIDGEPVHEQTWGPNEIPIPVPDHKSGEFVFEGVFETMDQQDMMLILAGSYRMPMEFDYLRIWQHGGTPPATVVTLPSKTTKAPTTTTEATTTKATTTKKPTVATTTEVTQAPTTTMVAENVTTATTLTTQATQATAAEPTGAFPWVAIAVPSGIALLGVAVWLVVKRKRYASK